MRSYTLERKLAEHRELIYIQPIVLRELNPKLTQLQTRQVLTKRARKPAVRKLVPCIELLNQLAIEVLDDAIRQAS